MKRSNSIGVVFASVLVLMAGLGSVALLAQVSPPTKEAVQLPGEGSGSSVGAATEQQQPPSGDVQERAVPMAPGRIEPPTIAPSPRPPIPRPPVPPTTGGPSTGPVGGLGGVTAPPSLTIAPLAVVVMPPPFYVVSYGGKCLDFGPPPQVTGSPVFLYGCNGTIAQQVVVDEIMENPRHEVILRAGTKVIGVKHSMLPPQVASRGTVPTPLQQNKIGLGGLALGTLSIAPDAPLELQDELIRHPAVPSPQIFALDGDSIILAADRTRVVEVQNNRGANRTPLVLGSRDLADNEFWSFEATDKSLRYPTSGFVLVPPIADPAKQTEDFVSKVKNARRGTVIEVHPSASINLSAVPIPGSSWIYIPIQEGVTIRGNRRGTLAGPELWSSALPNATLFAIAGNDVRITGLRLRGPSRGLDENTPAADGILAPDHYRNSIIDHNDMSDWPGKAVNVMGTDVLDECDLQDKRDPLSRPRNVRVARNFFHHNQRWASGYGVGVYNGAYPLIEGNTFVSNRHAIAGDGRFRSGYSAQFNLVLAATPNYSDHGAQQDFDMHGRGSAADRRYVGGIAGQYMEIARNTFLGANRLNFYLRGDPCYLAEFNYNILVDSLGDTIKNVGQKKLPATGNRFNAPNPTSRLGVGDFDGDGRDDLFLATGAAWYYAPAGSAEWRFLNAQTEGIVVLLFGDFDGDRRTDVFTQRGFDWLVSWGGASSWEKINVFSQVPMSDYAIGDFNGDRLADVFYADGKQWYISYGGNTPFTPVNTASFQVRDLGFGDFNGDGKTDVVGATSGQWMVSLSATGAWAGYPLRPALTNTMAGTIIADFNGNGRADIATAYGGKVSYDGRGGWTGLPARPGTFAAVGRFDAAPGADIVFYWTGDNHLGIQSSGVGSVVRHSTQHMR